MKATVFQIPNRSKEIISRQNGPHDNLIAVLQRHCDHEWRQPLHQPTVEAFGDLQKTVTRQNCPLILDSGCGTGQSTRLIAEAFPDSLVIGVDKSTQRLSRTGARTFPHQLENTIWLRAELESFWRLALTAGWKLQHHFLLYPNPWPKPGQLKRRWHAHPVFPTMLALGGRIELRCNWKPYAQEFAQALDFVNASETQAKVVTENPSAEPPSEITTPFERKYRASGHTIYSVSAELSSSSRVK